MTASSALDALDDLIGLAPPDKTAVIVPEAKVSVSYRALRTGMEIVPALAALLASAELDRAANLRRSVREFARGRGLAEGDVCLLVPGTAVEPSLSIAALATLTTSGRLILPMRFNPLVFWRLARDYGATWYAATPAEHQWLLARAADPRGRRPAGSERLRFILSCGAPLPARVGPALEAAFGAPVFTYNAPVGLG